VLDYHLHLWPHGQQASAPRLEELAAYCERAAARGVTEIALTEHLFRFRQADAVLHGFWDDDPKNDSTALRAQLAHYWAEHNHADLDDYVTAVQEAKAAGLPVVLGLEVDHYRDRMHTVADLLDGYPFDVLLGSVHWIGAWGFDNYDDPTVAAEWDHRAIEDVWRAYTDALEELADSNTCDVLAHPDLCKVTGRVPPTPGEFYDRMAEAAARTGMAAEVSSAGWRKPANEAYPAPPLLARFHDLGVPVTTASDAHHLDHVADRSDDLKALLKSAGYDKLTGFRARRQEPRAIAW
jgi:histidinol-phosphatase (PHP family)